MNTHKIEKKFENLLNVSSASLYEIETEGRNKFRLAIRNYKSKISLTELNQIHEKITKLKLVKKDFDYENIFLFGKLEIEEIFIEGDYLSVILLFPKTHVYINHDFDDLYLKIGYNLTKENTKQMVKELKEYLLEVNPELKISNNQVKDYLINFLFREDDY